MDDFEPPNSQPTTVNSETPALDDEATISLTVRNDDALLVLCDVLRSVRAERDALRAEIVALGLG